MSLAVSSAVSTTEYCISWSARLLKFALKREKKALIMTIWWFKKKVKLEWIERKMEDEKWDSGV